MHVGHQANKILEGSKLSQTSKFVSFQISLNSLLQMLSSYHIALYENHTPNNCSESAVE